LTVIVGIRWRRVVIVDEESAPRTGPLRLTIEMSDDLTEDHAMQLIVSGQKAGCPDLSITCKPTLVSCTPVTQCVDFNINAPGCSPLECNPVKTQIVS
jgi:hypothetical protein